MPSAEFDAAAGDVQKLPKSPSDKEKLQLYGLYKQATGGDFASAKEPSGVFDMAGKAKYNAWKKEKDVSPADAEKRYIALVDELKTKYA